MLGWVHVGAAAAASGILVLFLVAFFWRCCCYHYKVGAAGGSESFQLQTVIARPSVHHRVDFDHKKGNYSVFQRGVAKKPLFSWADHPSLVTDAVENGWSGFGFTAQAISSPSARSSFLGLCAAGDCSRHGSEVEIGWEISQGSADLIQKMVVNAGMKIETPTVVRTALPLPGPPLGDLSFPQEAYFEITVLYSGDGADGVIAKMREDGMVKLMKHNSNSNSNTKADLDSFVYVSKVDEMSSKVEAVVACIGLTGGGSLPVKLPGSYPGSVSFNSNGSVFLDGMKLVFESEKAGWGKDRVIGCGFDPRDKKVFFTVDSELVHVFRCQSEEFGTPMYPTLAANSGIAVLINFGQSAFKYAPANGRRTPNPCFTAAVASPLAATLGYDSKELFSMGRIDAQWLNRPAKSNRTKGNNNEECGAELEGDLFEIALGRSPKTAYVT